MHFGNRTPCNKEDGFTDWSLLEGDIARISSSTLLVPPIGEFIQQLAGAIPRHPSATLSCFLPNLPSCQTYRQPNLEELLMY